MTKERYMALADLQTVWTNTMKPAIPGIALTIAPVSTATALWPADSEQEEESSGGGSEEETMEEESE